VAGGKADLRGEDGAIYNLLSAKNISVAALFKHTTFTMPGPRKKLVHGSFMYDVSAGGGPDSNPQHLVRPSESPVFTH
jgi:hypothetical protein